MRKKIPVVKDQSPGIRPAPAGGTGATPKSVPRPRFGVITRFRAVAIILIVAGHSYEAAGILPVTGIDSTISNLIKGSTALFVFLSGFIFNHVFSVGYNYRNFVIDRARKILIPYCALTILAGFIFSNWAGGGFSSGQLFSYFFRGDTFQAYWYVPFILLMFALAPLHRWFMKMDPLKQVVFIIGGAILGALAQRPIENDNAVHSVVFYSPVYLSGLYLSLHSVKMLPLLKKYWPKLLLVAVLLAVLQTLDGQIDNRQKRFFAIHGFELMGIQKVALSAAFFGLFATVSAAPGLVVRVLADTSFAIFFLHPFALEFFKDRTIFHVTGFPWLNLAIATTAIATVSALIALFLRKQLKGKSKYLIGY